MGRLCCLGRRLKVSVEYAESRTPLMLCRSGSSLLIGLLEGGGGKIKLLNAGAYRDHEVDISLITHPGITPDAALVR